jgi:hypothetical protein
LTTNTYFDPPEEEVRNKMKKSGKPNRIIYRLLDLYEAFSSGLFSRIHPTVERVIWRNPKFL